MLAFQCFGEAPVVKEKLTYWAKLTGKPVLLADNAVWYPTAHKGWPPQEDRHHRPEAYAAITQALQEIPECVGFHLCGAYLRNRVRRYGLKDASDQVDSSTAGITEVNQATARWVTANARG